MVPQLPRRDSVSLPARRQGHVPASLWDLRQTGRLLRRPARTAGRFYGGREVLLSHRHAAGERAPAGRALSLDFRHRSNTSCSHCNGSLPPSPLRRLSSLTALWNHRPPACNERSLLSTARSLCTSIARRRESSRSTSRSPSSTGPLSPPSSRFRTIACSLSTKKGRLRSALRRKSSPQEGSCAHLRCFRGSSASRSQRTTTFASLS